MISLIHPSRGRPQKAFETYQNWIKKSSGTIPIEHILSLDHSDLLAFEYIKEHDWAITVHSDNNNVVEATNRACIHARGEILIYLSDDFDCPEGWDVLVKSCFTNMHVPQLLKVNDCLQPFDVAVLTIPIMNRKLYETLGYFWHPKYKSMFVDEDLYWTCKNNGWIIDQPNLNFPHLHCSIGLAENDETYTRSAANWDSGKQTFQHRKDLNFPLA
jgi:hypothetical protein